MGLTGILGPAVGSGSDWDCSIPSRYSGIKEQNISEEWLPADEPAAGPTALVEVLHAEIPSR